MFHFFIACLFITIVAPVPQFDPSALFQEILIPADAANGSIIYRLRAHDPTISYPLIFTLEGEPTTVGIETLNCSRLNSICQANVVLRKRLEIGRFYDFGVIVQNQRGENSKLNCSFSATNATTPISDIFPGAPTLLKVAENARRNTELGTIKAKGNPARPNAVLMELYGTPQFGLHQKIVNSRDAEATIVLLGGLDYEKQTMHHLTILANDPWTVITEDTRNIAAWSVLVAVEDVQDTPPVFTLAPPTTTLSPTLLPGDTVLRIHAEDGDRGNPRPIRYGLVPEGNPFTSFFNISEETGELRLARPLNEILAISHSGQPLLLTVIAEEVRNNMNEPPAQSSTARLALIPPGIRAGTPIFGANEYSTLLDENAKIGTVLKLAQAEVVADPGNFIQLSLSDNNGTFDIQPSVVEGEAKFQVKVHDPKLLDYEKWHSVQCYIVASEIGTNFTAKAKLEVILSDVNDNAPQFGQAEYQSAIRENAPVGTTVTRIEATDIDREPGNKIRYTGLLGPGSEFFNIDPSTGVITVSNSAIDAEKTPILSFFAEAADEDGRGKSSTVPVTVTLEDVNDEAPKFDKSIYEFILHQDNSSFTTRAFIKATDADITSKNNKVHYELIKLIPNLHLDDESGELVVTHTWSESQMVSTIARAYDNGVPILSSECEIRIYPFGGQSKRRVFIVQGRKQDLEEHLEDLRRKLSVLAGGRITFNEIRPYSGSEPGVQLVNGEPGTEKSEVDVTITYSNNPIDVNNIKEVIFDDKRKSRTDSEQVQTASKSSSGNLLWLFILLIILALILALILILCCICQGCPLYVPPKRRKVVSASIQKVVQGSGLGRESKSVQVAEWFGRREAWTPVDHEAESLQRHEQERGSDRIRLHREPSRDQLYIREGNTDILRLITRGNDQVYVADSGKDILMRRYIDQQQAENTKIHLPNTVQKLQTEHELLEASLRQQNALLRQILLERERDLRLETQSLPAGTQTDQDQETQTEPLFLRPPRRKVRSDNDASEGSDEEISRIRARRRRTLRKIKTPIQEEPEIEEKPVKKSAVSVRHTRTSELRQKKARNSGIRQEVLREISASLERSDSENDAKSFSEDSLEEISPRSEKTTDSSKQKYPSESDVREVSPVLTQIKETKSQSQTDLTKSKPKKKKKQLKKTSRYMEWYNKNQKSKDEDSKSSNVVKDEKVAKKIPKRLLQDTESSAKKKVEKKAAGGPEHPLLQHSEHRFEAQYPIVKKPEEEKDTDSGIALARLPIAQKKSVFTIAYDDMHTSQLRPDSHSPPL